MSYSYTERERDQVMANFVKNGKVVTVPSKEKKKYILLHTFIQTFEEGKTYSEQDINAELLSMYSKADYVEQRRYLITFGLMNRTTDGSQYWLNTTTR